jgi:hypothetical protein
MGWRHWVVVPDQKKHATSLWLLALNINLLCRGIESGFSGFILFSNFVMWHVRVAIILKSVQRHLAKYKIWHLSILLDFGSLLEPNVESFDFLFKIFWQLVSRNLKKHYLKNIIQIRHMEKINTKWLDLKAEVHFIVLVPLFPRKRFKIL